MTISKGSHNHGGSQARHGHKTVFKHIDYHDSIHTHRTSWQYSSTTTLSHDSIQARHGHNTVFKYTVTTVFKHSYDKAFKHRYYHQNIQGRHRVFKCSRVTAVFKQAYTHSHGCIQAQDSHDTAFKHSDDHNSILGRRSRGCINAHRKAWQDSSTAQSWQYSRTNQSWLMTIFKYSTVAAEYQHTRNHDGIQVQYGNVSIIVKAVLKHGHSHGSIQRQHILTVWQTRQIDRQTGKPTKGSSLELHTCAGQGT